MRIGTMFIDEMPVRIQRIYLDRGEFVIETVPFGPATIPAGCEIRVHDPEGKLVTVVPGRHKDLKIPAGASLSLPLHVDSVKGWPR